MARLALIHKPPFPLDRAHTLAIAVAAARHSAGVTGHCAQADLFGARVHREPRPAAAFA